MSPEDDRRMMELCKAIQDEQDMKEFGKLVAELSELLTKYHPETKK